ncbi:uncharacterized protein Dwil_GK27459 [Drosophila willistoni]|uniref:DUF4794 domain-containing protein n=1 Tax=Drosophila willistoni TaxID=7260 RepID=A0A0Q9WPB3_DROWI|nr:uncharacterized protein Dwil_GK27459 [Drosophila willistoni]
MKTFKQFISVLLAVVLVGLASATGIARTYLPPVRQVHRQTSTIYRPQVQVPLVRPPAVYLPPSPSIVSVSRPAYQPQQVVSISRPVAIQRPVAVVQAVVRPERVYLPPAPQRLISQPRLAVKAISVPRLVAPQRTYLPPQRTYLPPQTAAASSLSEQYEETNEL